MMLVMSETAMRGSTVVPGLRYRDAHAAIEWLVKALGFTKQAVYATETTVMHAQLTHGLGMVMLGSVKEDNPFHKLLVQPDEIGGRETTTVCLNVADCDAVYATAKAAGAEIIQELHSPEYGGKAFGCRDLEGHIWWVGSYDPWAEHDEVKA